MKSDFLLAITQLSAEKNLPKEVVIAAVEAALASAYRKDNFAPNQNIAVRISPTSGEVEVWAEKTVVEKPTDNRKEIALDKARKIKPSVQLGETVMEESTPPNAGRIAAQTAKQVILQRLHEAEHSAVLEEFAGKEGDIITGVIQRLEPKQLFINLGRAEAVLPSAEQVPGEKYRVGQRLKVFLLEVSRTARGPRLIVSRSHPNLLKRLFELEIPEVYNGTVEIKAIAREAGFRSKVAVAARQEGIDPVGCCVGLRGLRIQNIVSELNNEKLDIIAWSPNTATFIASALSPAHVVSVELSKEGESARVVVPDRQLSLAIGKEGQNVRLAAKLTGWRIDIKNATEAEAEKAAQMKAAAEAAPAVEPKVEEVTAEPVKVKKAARAPKVKAGKEEIPPVVKEAEKVLAEKEAPAEVVEVEAAAKPAEVAEKVEEEVAEVEAEEKPEEVEEPEPQPVMEMEIPEEILPKPQPTPAGKPVLRFAEDIFGSSSSRGKGKQKKKRYHARQYED